MRKDDRIFVGHALDTARRVAVKVAGIDRAAFDGDENLRIALVHLLQIIGEASSRVSAEFRERSPLVPWAAITGMRDRIVHDDLNINETVVWQTATEEMASMIAMFEAILRGPP
jgi:uncharacterized protein with HEPN domain